MAKAGVEVTAANSVPAAGRAPPWAGIGDAVVLLHRLVPAGVLCALARMHGRVGYYVRRRAAAAVRANVAPFVSPGESAATVARRFFEDFETRRLLLALAPRLPVAELRRWCTLRNVGHLEQAVETGRGALLLLSHLHSRGGLLAVIILRKLGHDVRTAMPTLHDPWSSTRLRRLMWALGGPEPTLTELLGGFPCQFNIRPIVKALGEGAVVMQTGDGWHSARFVDVPFLGRRVPFPTGMLSVAQTTGVPVVPVFGAGRATRMTFTLEEPFEVGRGPGALEAAVAHYAARLDLHVRAEPAAWEHWTLPNALDTLATWSDRPLRERYEV
jgi:lauroyl/myristoyl acyltransferase